MSRSKARFVPESLRNNPYRILRLTADASSSEIHKAAAAARRELMLGGDMGAADYIDSLGTLKRSETAIRAAVGELSNPAQRLRHRLFWFSSKMLVENNALAARHDAVLRDLFNLVSSDWTGDLIQGWEEVLQAWHAIVTDDGYWTPCLSLEDRGGFEPAAGLSDIENIRAKAIQIAAEPLLVTARDAVLAEDFSTAGQILAATAQLSHTGVWAREAQFEVASAPVEHFSELCRSVRDECGSQISRTSTGECSNCGINVASTNRFCEGCGTANIERNDSEQNRTLCEKALVRFRSEVTPGMSKLFRLLPADHDWIPQCRELAAACLSGIATDYTWADDFITAESLKDEAITLAMNSVTALRIEGEMENVRASARRQEVFGALKPITSAPPCLHSTPSVAQSTAPLITTLKTIHTRQFTI